MKRFLIPTITILIFLGGLLIVSIQTGIPKTFWGTQSRREDMSQIPKSADSEAVTTPVHVEDVKTFLPLISPPTIHLEVYGQKVFGVDVKIQQGRKEREVIVTMTQTYPYGIKARLEPFRQFVVLNGTFTLGTYSLKVNDYVSTFEVR